MSTCRSCGAAIIWARTHAGKLMPLDATATPLGTFELQEEDGRCLFVGSDAPGDKYLSHFSTCPNAKQHRKAKDTGGPQ